ncbi:MAG: HAMP domain-containing protein [Deltaproteobacteria bacterium]|nr:HAMP domain-containing protein [Deltaproteobacteria bacterium]
MKIQNPLKGLRSCLKTKLLLPLGLQTALLILLMIFAGLYLIRLQQNILMVSDSIYPAYVNAQMLTDKLRESKNWVVRYTLERDPTKLGTWKSNYQKLYQEVEVQLHKLDNNTSEKIKTALVQSKHNIHEYTTLADTLFETHEELLAKAQFKESLQKEYEALFDAQLSTLRQLEKQTPILTSAIEEMIRLLSQATSLFSKSLVMPFEVLTEEELTDRLEDRKQVFLKNMKRFDEKWKMMATQLTEPRGRQHLHQIKILNLKYREMLLNQGKLYDFYQDEIKNMLTVWKSIDTLNEVFEKTKASTEILASHVQASLSHTLSQIQSTRIWHARLFFIFLGVILAFGILLGFYFSKYLIDPLQTLTTSIEKMGEGNLEQKIPVDACQDEISRLSIAFNDMADRLHRMRAQLRLSNQDILKLYRALQNKVSLSQSDHQAITPKDTELLESNFISLLFFEIRNALSIIQQALSNLDIPSLTQEEKQHIMDIVHETIRNLVFITEKPIEAINQSKTKRAA